MSIAVARRLRKDSVGEEAKMWLSGKLYDDASSSLRRHL
jgi:hypothetical protein